MIVTMILLTFPCQKLAQRDQPAMVELLQICCLMNYVWPKVQTYLGAGKLLDGIMDQWKAGCLGCEVDQNRVNSGGCNRRCQSDVV